ncbi:hypothetical protein [Streptomyces syringium]|uniref:hypothetical protein n=1 Tax=Streptomyces syringium TaxID=76729 RepID=UPI00342E0294
MRGQGRDRGLRVESVPAVLAVLAVSDDAFIVHTSAAFAILGLTHPLPRSA